MTSNSDAETMTNALDVLRTSSLSQAVYKEIEAIILGGSLQPGERLNEKALAERFGVSRGPVREALQLLRGEGFVFFTQNRGARVRPIDQDFIRDINEIGVLIEPARQPALRLR